MCPNRTSTARTFLSTNENAPTIGTTPTHVLLSIRWLHTSKAVSLPSSNENSLSSSAIWSAEKYPWAADDEERSAFSFSSLKWQRLTADFTCEKAPGSIFRNLESFCLLREVSCFNFRCENHSAQTRKRGNNYVTQKDFFTGDSRGGSGTLRRSKMS